MLLWKLSATMFLKRHDGKTEVSGAKKCMLGRRVVFHVCFVEKFLSNVDSLWKVKRPCQMNFLVMFAMDLSNLVMQMAWVMQVEQKHNTKKMSMTSNNFYHLFQRCPWKMMSKTSEAGIHMYMMKAHKLMGVWGCRATEEFLSLVVTCPLSTNTVEGSHDRSCCFHALSFCLYVDAGQGWETNPVGSVFPLSKHVPLFKWLALIFSQLKKKKNLMKRRRSSYFSFLEYSSSMDGLIRGWRNLLWPKKNPNVYKLLIIIMHVNKHD